MPPQNEEIPTKLIKTIKWFYYTSPRIIKIKRQKMPNIGEIVEQLELPQNIDMTVNWLSQLGKLVSSMH